MTNPYIDMLQAAPAAAPGGEPPANPYLDMLQSADEQRRQQMAGQLTQAVGVNPEQYTAQRRVAQYLGYPTPVVEAQPHLMGQAKVRQIQQDTANAPVLQRKYTDSDFAKLAHDDAPILSKIETAVSSAVRYAMGADQYGGMWGDLKRGAWDNSVIGTAGAFRMVSELGASAAELVPAVRSLEASGQYGGNPLRRLAEGFAMIGANQQALKDASSPPAEGNIAGGVSSGFQSAGQNLKYLPLAFLGPVGWAAGLTGMVVESGGTTYQKDREEGVPMGTATIHAAADGLAEYVGERYFGEVGFLKRLAAGAPATKLLMWEITRDVPGEIGTTLWQNFNDWALTNPSKTADQFLREQPDAIVQTAIGALVGGGVQVGVGKLAMRTAETVLNRQMEVTETLQREESLKALMQLAGQAKLAERSPEQLQAFVAEASGDATVRFDAATLVDVFKQDANALAQALPSVDLQALQEAAATGGEVTVPLAELVVGAKAAGVEQTVLEHARLGDSTLSAAEARDVQSRMDGELGAQVSQAIAQAQDQDAARQSHEAVRSNIEQQIIATGRHRPAVAEQMATWAASFFTTYGSRLGITAEEMYQRYPLRVVGAPTGQGGGVAEQGAQDQRDLVVTHNLTADNLLHAVKMGGLAVPSLAVTKKDSPLTGFGEITLIGDKAMADPKGYAGAKVFGADIYSPRYPNVTLEFTPSMRKRGEAQLKEGMAATGRSYFDWSEVERDGAREVARTAPFMWQFLTGRGITPDVKRTEVQPLPPELAPDVKRTEVQPLPPELAPFAESKLDRFDLVKDPGFVAAAWKMRRDLLVTLNEGNEQEADAELASEKQRVEERGKFFYANELASQVENHRRDLRDSGKIDNEATHRALESQIREAGLTDELQSAAAEFISGLGPNERIFQGFTNSGNRKYIPHTLENVVKILKKELRGGENFNYGVGSLRAKFTPQFKSIEQIRKAKDRLVSKEDFVKVKKEINNQFWVVAAALNKDLSSTTALSILEDAAKLGVKRAAKNYGYEISDDAAVTAAEFLTRLRELPTEYFEAKILRDVDLAEFAGAVVPEDADPRVIAALQARGVKDIRTYKTGDEADRKAKLGEFESLFFQNQQAPRGTLNPKTLELVLNPNANLSTWFHETGHFFLEVLADVASQPNAPAQIVGDMNTFLKWAGITGDENVGGPDAGGALAQADDRDTVYKEIAADEEVVEALEAWMVDGAPPNKPVNDKLLAYMRRLPPVPSDSYLTFYRGQPRGVSPHPRGWASWTTNKDETRFFTEGNGEVLTRKGVRGISLEEVALWRTRATGQLHDYGSQGEWLVLNESVFNQDGQPAASAPPITPKRVGGPDAGGELAQAAAPAGVLTGDDGKPLVLYHGTNADIQKFDAGMADTGAGQSEGATWFSSSPVVTERFGAATMPVYLTAANVFEVTPQNMRDLLPVFGGGMTVVIDGRPVTADINREAMVDGREANVLDLLASGRAQPVMDADVRKRAVAAAKKTGADAVVFRGFYDASDTPSDIYAVFDPKQIVSAISGEVLGQEGQPATAQPIQRKRTPLETWNAMTLDQKRPYHERWAESIEQYVMEGRAPSVELQPLMRRFATWLKSVYGSIKAFLASRGVAPAGGETLGQGAGDQTQTPAFKAWFGDSKVVDAGGKPLVVYHGRSGDFTEFNTSGGTGKTSGTGAFFTASPAVAATYTGGAGNSANIAPVYLRIKAPLVVDAGGSNWSRIAQKARVEMSAREALDADAQESENIAAALEDRDPEILGPVKKKAKRTNVRELFKGEWDYPDDTATTDDIARWARKQGFDGVIFHNVVDQGPTGQFHTEASKAPSDLYVVFAPEQIKSAIGNDGTFDANDPSILSQDPAAPAGPPMALNDDIRRVMDRMLATDEQIAQANEVAGLVPDEAADGEAAERLRKRSIADLKWAVKARDKALAKLRKAAKGIEKEVRAQVTEEVNQRPEVQAKDALDKLRADKALDDASMAATADAFGYDSTDAMLKAIDAFGSKAEAIDGMTEQRMLEEHGDLVDERAIAAAANEAVHNEARARSLATELRTQSEMLNARADTGQTNAKGSRVTVNVLMEAAKQFGANVAARTQITDMRAAAWRHTQAERRAAKRHEEATAAGKTQEAVKAKQDQVLQHAAARALIEAQDEVRKTLDFFKRVATGNDETVVKKGRDADIVNAARAVLAAYGVETPTTKRADDYLDVIKQNDPETYAAIAPMVDEATRNAQPLRALTVGELQALSEQIGALWYLAKRSRQMEIGGDLLDIDDLATQLNGRMEEIGIPDTVPGEAQAVTKREARALFIRQGLSFLKRVEQWAEGMDGRYGGPFLRYVFQPIKAAADAYRADRTAYRKKLEALVSNLAPIVGDKTIDAPELGYTFGGPDSTKGVAMNEVLHALLHTGNESNKRKLLLGRQWATENADGTLDTSRWDSFIQRLVATGKLQREHFDFVQGVWDLLEETKPLARKAHRDAFGRYFAEVTAAPFVDPFGVPRKGGYVPAMVDPALVKDNALRKIAEAENESMSYAFPQPGKGFTMSRVEGYNRALMLDLRTIGQHLDKVLLFSRMTVPARSVRRLVTHKAVSQPLDRIDPTALEVMLQPWLQRSAQQVVETPIPGSGGWARVPSIIRARAGMALMFANVSNAIQQATGLSTAMVKVKPGFIMRAMAQHVAHPGKAAAAVWEASSYMNDRAKNEVAVLNENMRDILLDPSPYEKAQAWSQRHAYFLQTAIDNALSPIVWTGAYNQAMADGMTHDDAVAFADGTVRQTQGSTLPEDVSRFETGPAYARAFTQFIGYFNMVANTNVVAIKQIVGEMGLKRGAGRLFSVVMLGMMVPIWAAEAIAQAFKGGPDDEDKDGLIVDDWLAAVFGFGTAKGLLAMVPIVGQAANSAVTRLDNNPMNDRISLSPGLSLIESAAGGNVQTVAELFNPDKDVNARRAVRDAASLVSIATGLPLYAIARPAGYAAGVAQGKIEPTGPVDAARGLITGTPSPESKVR